MSSYRQDRTGEKRTSSSFHHEGTQGHQRTEYERLLLRKYEELKAYKTQPKQAIKRVPERPAETQAPAKRQQAPGAALTAQPPPIRPRVLNPKQPASPRQPVSPAPAAPSLVGASAAREKAFQPAAPAAPPPEQPAFQGDPAVHKERVRAALAAKLKRQEEQRAAERAAKQAAPDEPAEQAVRPAAKQSAPAQPQKQQPSKVFGKRMAPVSPDHGKRNTPAKPVAPAAPTAPAAEEQVLDYEVDYNEVESPPYEVDYDAEKSPPYEGVSGPKGTGAAAAAGAADTLGQQQQQQQPLTPERSLTAAGPGPFGSSRRPKGLDIPDARCEESGPSTSRSPLARTGSWGGSGRRDGETGRSRGSSYSRDERRCRRDGSGDRRSYSPDPDDYRQGGGSRGTRSYSQDEEEPQPHSKQRRGSSRSPERSRRGGGYGSSSRGGSARSRSRSRSADGRQRHRGGSRGNRSNSSYEEEERGVDKEVRETAGRGSLERQRKRGSRDRPIADEGGWREERTRTRSRSRSRSRSRMEAGGDEDEMEEGQAEDEVDVPTEGKGKRKGKAPQTGAPGRTLFVGDLPVFGFASVDLKGLFEGLGLRVDSARVMGSQCYGFVEFATAEEAKEALEAVASGDPVFVLQGRAMRASWARGTMPNWKRGKAVIRPRGPGQAGLEGLEAYEHPSARMARLGVLALPQLLGGGGQGEQFMAADGRNVIDYTDI